MYPNDHALKGSAAAFVALHQRMLARDVVAVCSFVRSRAAVPALGALAAAQEAKDEHGAQARPGLPRAAAARAPRLRCRAARASPACMLPKL